MFWNPAVNLLVLLKVGGAILVCMAVRMGAIVEPLRSCKHSDKDRHRVDRRIGPTTPLLAQGSVTNLLTFNVDLKLCQKMKGQTTMGQSQLGKGSPTLQYQICLNICSTYKQFSVGESFNDPNCCSLTIPWWRALFIRSASATGNQISAMTHCWVTSMLQQFRMW